MADCKIVFLKQCEWTFKYAPACLQERLDEIKTCTAKKDQGYNKCTQQATHGYSQCTGWKKWFCRAWTWITYAVCVVSVWVENFVCVAWAWIKQVACVVWGFLKWLVCVLVAGPVFLICAAPLFFVNALLYIRGRQFVFLQCLRPRDKPRNSLEKPGWTLTFEDDFTAGAVDLGRWKDHTWWGDRFIDGDILKQEKIPNVYLEPHDGQPPPFQFGPSTIRHRSHNQPVELVDKRYPTADHTFWVPYTGTWLEWVKARAQVRGYFEIRCKVPDTSELYPAFWLASHESWPPEIDIFEFNKNHTDKYTSTIHWGTKENKKMAVASHRACKAAKHFHIYACEWTAADVRFYYDNVLIRIATIALAEFDYPMIVIVNNGPDAREHHHPENGTYPNWLEVDYVRAYRR